MNDHILNMLKADLTVLDKLGIKPNFADLARKYKMDYRTVKKYYEGYKGKPKNRNCRSKLEPYASIIEEKLSISRISHKGVYRMLLSKYGEKKIGSYTNFMCYCKKNKLSPGYVTVVLIMQLLWWFGIHGPNVMGDVTGPFMTKMMAQNLELYQAGEGITASGVFYTAGSKYSIIANPFASGWFGPTGSGITMGLIIAIMLFSKRDDFKAIAKLSIPCGIFNINEPIIFGIPMVMNVMFAVPFFLTPVACVCCGYLVRYLGLCPLFVIDVPWTTPIGLFGFLASSGNIMGAIWQVVIILGVSTLIYTPFVIASNRQTEEA